jgi:hypothetical protein
VKGKIEFMYDTFDMIANKLKLVRTKINVEYKLEGFSFRDFQNLSYNARKIYEKKYKFKKKCADISHKFCTFFEICFKKINRLPIMAPSDSLICLNSDYQDF